MRRFTISGILALLLLHLFSRVSIGQTLYGAFKLKNASGTISTSLQNGFNGPIDSIRYDSDVFWLYSKNGVSELTIPPFAPSRTVIQSTFSPSTGNPSIIFSATDAGNGKVNCISTDTVFASTDGGVSFHVNYVTTITFSYTRETLQLKLGAASASDTSILSSKADKQTQIFFHYMLDGSVNDTTAPKVFSLKFQVTNSKGMVVDNVINQLSDSSIAFPSSLFNQPPADSYLAKLSVLVDSMFYVPSSGISYHIIINPAIYQAQCKGLSWLKFDASYSTVPDSIESPTHGGKGWQGGGGIDIIQDSGTIIINDILRFRGIMQIDTSVNGQQVKANGEFYVFTRLPLTQKAGAWRLGTANWPPFSYTCNTMVKRVQTFLSDSIAGFKFSVDSIFFITDSLGLSGVRLGVTVAMPFIVPGACGDQTKSPSPSVSLAPIEITRNGIGGAIHINNVGIAPQFCVNNIFASYYAQPDSFSIGADIKTPFSDKIALSAGWIHGKWDAVSFAVQQATGGIPIGETGMFLSGVRGSASGWNDNQIFSCSIGGTFDDVTHKFTEWEGDVKYKAPFILSGSLKLSFFNVPPVGWQIVLKGLTTINYLKNVRFDGDVQEGSLGNGYIFTGKGNLTYAWRPVRDLIGKATGSFKIPKLFKNNFSPITDAINDYLPITIASAEMSLKAKIVKANISVPFIASAHMQMNLNLPSSDSNFIDFGRGTIPLNIAHRSGKNQIASLTMDSIHIPSNVAFAVIRIRSNGIPSNSSVIDPANKMHTNASNDSLVQYSTDP
ncbi:MAG: hypothetical protein ACHQM6_04860, partial [Candidatus Kapaibacterium sp.]